MNEEKVLIRAGLIVDAVGTNASPGVILLEGNQIVTAGAPEAVGAVSDTKIIDVSDSVVMPGLVNCHTHLDLTHIGPQPYSGRFATWLEMIRNERTVIDGEVAASVQEGIKLSRAGGTAIVGDIAGDSSLVPIGVMRSSGMAGVSFLEVFGLGHMQSRANQTIKSAIKHTPAWESGVQFGLQPHAPYSCGPDVYRAAATLGLPIATHVAESLEEIEFVRSGNGPIREMLNGFGVIDDSVQFSGKHPVDFVAENVHECPWLAVHANYLDESHLEKFAELPVTVVYCPRASEYFGHTHHRYQELLERGANVAIGTDSLVCLDTSNRISVLDEMRFLFHRDGTDPHLLLRMATVGGAKALGFDEDIVTLKRGHTVGLVAVPFKEDSQHNPLHSVLLNNEAPTWVTDPIAPRDSWRTAESKQVVHSQ